MAHVAMHGRSDSGVSVNSVINPPSPTLTNPDMIVPIPPWQHEPSFDEGPHPLLEPEIPLSQSLAPSAMASTRTSGASASDVEVATAVLMPSRLSVHPPTTIYGSSTPIPTYTGYEHGAPLSDIYEESEATATPKSMRHRSPSPPRSPPVDRDDSATPTRPALRHKKRISSLSTSSSGGSDVGDWENFDSSKVLTSRVAADLAQMRREDTLEVDDATVSSRRQSREEEELAALNARAEKILENARKRLTNMDANLKSARNSIIMPARSPNLGGEHQPVGGLYRSISAAGASKLGNPKQKMLPIRTSASLQHMRGMSETGVSSTTRNLSRLPDARSASAMEYSQTGRYSLLADPSASSRIQPSPASSRSYNSPLRPLEEERASPSTAETTPESVKAPQMRGLGILSAAAVSRDNLASAIDQSAARQTPTPTLPMRSTSAASTRSARELKEQMTDLKTRIADLRSKAQADHLRRRSLQSIRSSSPFTNAPPENWYASSPAYQESSSPISSKGGVGWKGPDSPTAPRPSLDVKQDDNNNSLPITPANARFLDVDRMTPDAETKILSSARTDRNTPTLARQWSPEPVNGTSGDEEEEEEGFTSSGKGPSQQDKRSDGSGQEDSNDNEEDTELIAENEEEQIYLNEVLEESLRDAEVEPEVPAIPDGYLNNNENAIGFIGPAAQRHEDRFDAFDYENMFLHSAMGNYTGKSINGSESGSDKGSDGDDDDNESVETSRAQMKTPTEDPSEHSEVETATDEEMEDMIAEDSKSNSVLHNTSAQQSTDAKQPASTSPEQVKLPVMPQTWAHTRSNSAESVSTSATFETATEGEDDMDETPTEIYNWDPMPSSSLGYSPTQYQAYRSNQNSPLRARHGFSSPQGGGRSTPLAQKSSATNSPLKQQQKHYEIRYDQDKAMGSPGLGLGVVGGENAQFINDNGVPERFQGRPSPGHSRQGSAVSMDQQRSRPESQATIVPASPLGTHRRQISSIRSPLTPNTQKRGSPVVVTVTSSPQRKVVINRALQQPESYTIEPQIGSPPNMPLPAPPASSAALQAQMASPKKITVKRTGSAQKNTPPLQQTGQSPASQKQAHQGQLSTPPLIREGAVSAPPVGPVPNTEILMESLIKLADPSFTLAPGIRFEEVDKNLVLGLLGAVGGVCNSILRASVQSGSPELGKTHAEALVSMLRTRLDNATIVLEGQRDERPNKTK